MNNTNPAGKKPRKVKIRVSSLTAMYLIGLFLFTCSIRQFQEWGIKNDGIFLPYMMFYIGWTIFYVAPLSNYQWDKEE